MRFMRFAWKLAKFFHQLTWVERLGVLLQAFVITVVVVGVKIVDHKGFLLKILCLILVLFWILAIRQLGFFDHTGCTNICL